MSPHGKRASGFFPFHHARLRVSDGFLFLCGKLKGRGIGEGVELGLVRQERGERRGVKGKGRNDLQQGLCAFIRETTNHRVMPYEDVKFDQLFRCSRHRLFSLPCFPP